MTAIIDTRVFKLFMVFCLCMQAVAMMPHHHHGEDEIPCLNFVHCFGSQSGMECSNDGAKRGHEHDNSHGTSDTKCVLSDIEIIRIDTNDIRSTLLSDDDILAYAVFTVGSEEDACGHCYADHMLKLSIRCNIGVKPVHTAHIAVATPPRAPSFTV